jgi:hypothetical protein
LYDLSNSTSLVQQLIPCSVLPITKIFTIEKHKLDDAFRHVAIRSQKPIKDN